MALKIAIFGGSFDPPHNGHLAIIKALVGLDFLDLIIILPAFHNPLKNPPLFSTQTRLKCLEILAQEIAESCDAKNPTKIIVSDYEITQGKPSYTIDCVMHFKERYPNSEIYLTIGADNLATLPQWHKYSELLNLINLIVAKRDGVDITDSLAKLNYKSKATDSHKNTPPITILNINQNLNSSEIRQNLLGILSDSWVESKIPKNIIEIIKNEVKTLKNRLDFITNLLDSKKASDIVTIDLQGTDYITQFVIIATSLAEKHTLALLDTLRSELKPRGEQFFAVDEESGDWVIVDLGDIMIHLFTQNHRNKFNLEEFLNNYKQGK